MNSDNAFVQVRLEELVTQRQAMVTANEERARKGEAPAYAEADFLSLANTIHDLAGLVR